MQNRVTGPTESEFEVQNTKSTTDGHLLTTGRPPLAAEFFLMSAAILRYFTRIKDGWDKWYMDV